MPTWCSFSVLWFRKYCSTASALSTGTSHEQAGPDISQLAPHLRQEWDHEANAHLGSITIAPHSNRKVWWRSGRCKTGQPHRWQATVDSRSDNSSCPNNRSKAVCPCNDLSHNHPEVAAEWDWDVNKKRTPETVAAFSGYEAAWRCALCGHRWSTSVSNRTQGSRCPECAREAGRSKTRQPSISSGAPHLLAEWDWEANDRCGWHPDQVTLGSQKKVHWAVQDECKLGLVHRWQAPPQRRIQLGRGSPFPSGMAVCACNSLAVQCPAAADLWDLSSNRHFTPSAVAVQSIKSRGLEGCRWQSVAAEHSPSREQYHKTSSKIEWVASPVQLPASGKVEKLLFVPGSAASLLRMGNMPALQTASAQAQYAAHSSLGLYLCLSKRTRRRLRPSLLTKLTLAFDALSHTPHNHRCFSTSPAEACTSH